MPASYKLKVIGIGPDNSGKQYFFRNCETITYRFSRSYIKTVGVDICIAQYGNADNYLTMSLWNINSEGRFGHLLPTFVRGAAACLLFFNIIKSDFYDELEYWIEIIQNHVGNIPIFLIGYCSDSLDGEYVDIDTCIESYNLKGFFLIPNQMNLVINELGISLCERYGIIDLENEYTREELEEYHKFENSFQNCPKCGTRNHESYLRRFYFSKNRETTIFKRSLLELMNKSRDFDEIYLNKIRIGIPCCSCFKTVFSN